MKKTILNLAILQFLFVEVAFASDNEEEAEILYNFDLENEEECIKFIKVYLEPVYKSRSDNFRTQVDLSLHYIIETGNFDYVRMQQSGAFEVALSKDSKKFSKTIFEVLHGFDYKQNINFADYRIIEDAAKASREQWD